jgi:hypothetical protein
MGKINSNNSIDAPFHKTEENNKNKNKNPKFQSVGEITNTGKEVLNNNRTLTTSTANSIKLQKIPKKEKPAVRDNTSNQKNKMFTHDIHHEDSGEDFEPSKSDLDFESSIDLKSDVDSEDEFSPLEYGTPLGSPREFNDDSAVEFNDDSAVEDASENSAGGIKVEEVQQSQQSEKANVSSNQSEQLPNIQQDSVLPHLDPNAIPLEANQLNIDNQIPDQPVNPNPLVNRAQPPQIGDNILPLIDAQAINDITNYFRDDEKDNVEITPQRRLVNMMNHIQRYNIEPNSFKIDFKLDGEPTAAKIEPYIIGSKEYYKTKFEAIIKFKDHEGGQHEITFSRDIYSILTDRSLLPGNAKGFGEWFIDVALANTLGDKYEGAIHFDNEQQKRDALDIQWVAVNAKKNSVGKPALIEGFTGRGANNQMIKFAVNLRRLEGESHATYKRFENSEIPLEERYIQRVPYTVHFSSPADFMKSPHLSNHLKTIESRINESKNRFEKMQNEFGTYTGKKGFQKKGVKETKQLKKLVAELSLNENANGNDLQGISKATQRYLDKKREYLKLQDQVEKVAILLEKLNNDEPLNEEDQNLINFIKTNNPQLINYIKNHQNENLRMDESHPNFDRTLILGKHSILPKELDEAKKNLLVLAKEINDKNQKMLNHLFQFKDTIAELEVDKNELEILNQVSKPKPQDKDSLNKINTFLSELDKDIKTYKSFITIVESKLKIVPSRNRLNDTNTRNIVGQENSLLSTNRRVIEDEIIIEEEQINSVQKIDEDLPENEKVKTNSNNSPKISIFKRVKEKMNSLGDQIKTRLNRKENSEVKVQNEHNNNQNKQIDNNDLLNSKTEKVSDEFSSDDYNSDDDEFDLKFKPRIEELE